MSRSLIRLSASALTLAMGVLAGGTLRGQQPAAQSLAAVKTVAGLEVTLWASEPEVTNPTNMAIDERGRIWVVEAVNYRRQLRNQADIRQPGDRIVILEDTDGDGKSDKTTVFDQNPQIRAPLGIAVFGDRVIVSQAPDLTVYTKDASDKIVKKEVLLSGWLGVDHDHGLHAVVFGPDGRYYFNTGNSGYDVTDKSGRRVIGSNTDSGGKPTNAPGTYFGGSTMVANPDGTNLQVIAQNFRNPYEVVIDSFGNLWQTDNDDDGNQQVRANYVMEGGNYGFRGPYGRTWREDNGTHWHLELPGVVPNLLQLGPGSPCGLLLYEGKLLPEAFRGRLLHAEAGRRVISSYPIGENSAGFASRIDDVVFGGTDTWFRPTDVAVAPDGAVFLTDWYDPSVGGHGMGDPQGSRGRIFRLAPPAHRSTVPKLDLDSAAGLTAAFGSPNQAVFYLAHTKLRSQGASALPLLTKMWGSTEPTLKARSLWLLGMLGAPGQKFVQAALTDRDPKYRVLGLRVQRMAGADMLAVSTPLLKDPSPQVRREIALMLQDPSRMTPPYLIGAQTAPPAPLLDALTELARLHDGKDRWYLEAIGIAARGREDALYGRLRQTFPQWTPVLGQLLWELRAPASLPYLIESAKNPKLSIEDRVQAVDALSVMQNPSTAPQVIETLILDDSTPPAVRERAFANYRQQLFQLWTELRTSPGLPVVMKKALATPGLQAKAVELATALNDTQYTADLVALARSSTASTDTRAAALTLAGNARQNAHLADYEAMLATAPGPVRAAAFRAIDMLSPPDLEARSRAILLSDAPNDVRSAALRTLMRTPAGAAMVLELQESGKFPIEMKSLATTIANGRGFLAPGRGAGPGGRGAAPGATPDPNAVAAAAALDDLRARATKAFPPIATMSGAIPTVLQMERAYHPNAAAGRAVFESDASMCSACHSLGGTRKIGPDLSAIGTKFGKQAMLDAILTPSASIAPEYEYWMVETKSQGTLAGVILEDSAAGVRIATMTSGMEPKEVRLAAADVAGRKRLPISIMPEGLINRMTQQQVVDLIEFLSMQKGK